MTADGSAIPMHFAEENDRNRYLSVFRNQVQSHFETCADRHGPYSQPQSFIEIRNMTLVTYGNTLCWEI